MRHFLQVIGIASLLAVESFSNPIFDPYSAAMISEVYIASPSEWYVELDCEWDWNYGLVNTKYPCTVDVYLKVKASIKPIDGFCPVRVVFAANRIGVISRESIQPKNRQMYEFKQRSLLPTDTVIVALDTSLKAKYSWQKPYWKFPLRPVPEGSSLIALNSQQHILSTTRRSIGSRGNYQTRYQITARDSYKNPLEGIAVGETSGAWASTDKKGICNVTLSIQSPSAVATIFDYLTPHFSDGFQLCSLELSYDDKDSIINKIIEIPVTQYRLTFKGTDLSSLRAYKEDQYGLFFPCIIQNDAAEFWFFRVYKSEPVCKICFSSSSSPSADSQCLGTWTGKYIDTSAIIKKTITIAPNNIVSTRRPEIPAVKSGLTLSGLCENNRELRLVVSSALPIPKGSLSLYAINGKQITSQPIAMKGSGTSTVLFRFPGGQLTPGTYLCKLTIAGSKAAACPIIVP